jgi:hypothetical protein
MQRRLDHAGDAERDPILQLENVLQRAVEPAGSQMRAGHGIHQLPGDAHPAADFAD